VDGAGGARTSNDALARTLATVALTVAVPDAVTGTVKVTAKPPDRLVRVSATRVDPKATTTREREGNPDPAALTDAPTSPDAGDSWRLGAACAGAAVPAKADTDTRKAMRRRAATIGRGFGEGLPP
jgi:hypothetical protein